MLLYLCIQVIASMDGDFLIKDCDMSSVVRVMFRNRKSEQHEMQAFILFATTSRAKKALRRRPRIVQYSLYAEFLGVLRIHKYRPRYDGFLDDVSRPVFAGLGHGKRNQGRTKPRQRRQARTDDRHTGHRPPTIQSRRRSPSPKHTTTTVAFKFYDDLSMPYSAPLSVHHNAAHGDASLVLLLFLCHHQILLFVLIEVFILW